MKRKKSMLAALLLSCLGISGAWGQNFDTYFENRTLRLDYTFSGTDKQQQLFVDQLCSFPGWAGRRHHLKDLHLRGYGQITMCDAATGDTIYRNSFATLFQEWQGTEEATRVAKSFENCFLVPYPKNKVNITVSLFDNRGKISSSLAHSVDPKDILIRRLDSLPVTPHRYIRQNGSPEQCIDVAFVAEGYTAEQMPQFYKDCEVAVEALLDHEPFKSQQKHFNFVAVASESDDSGVSIPGKGIWKKTAVDSHFDTFYSDRYLTTLHLKQLHNLLAGVPYEHIVILANTENYGGGGIYNAYTLTSSRHETYRSVVVHEFGHSFAGLADEYYYDDEFEPMYPAGVEPYEQNITTLTDFDSKWKDMLPEGTPIPTPATGKDLYTKIGVYEGAGYQSKGVYRAFQDCRMKTNDAPVFCPVCVRILDRLIRFYTE